ncbi:hypothetical protein Tco_0706319 [Tanacetum coccineum]|uniref:Uncharacterized protein n=1 Tax=Tanacetum coccineum TaxID=301880 RepID=A0ABQ4Y8L6_9ASTR
MVRGEECLEGCVGAGGGEFSGGRDDFGVRKSLLGEISRVVIGEGGGETFGDDGGAVWLSVKGDRYWYGGDEKRGLLKLHGRTLILTVHLRLLAGFFSLFDSGIVSFLKKGNVWNKLIL